MVEIIEGGVKVGRGGNASGETCETCEIVDGAAINGGAINDESSLLAAGGGFPQVVGGGGVR